MPLRPPYPQPSGKATGVLLGGLALTATLVGRSTPTEMAHLAALGAGSTLFAAFALDMRGLLRNLVRADVMAICALYFLTLFEFLFPQAIFNEMVNAQEVEPAINACLVGLAGLALGRHLAPPAPLQLLRLLKLEFPPKQLLLLFWISIVLGYFYMLLSVDFNVVDWLNGMMAPRFAQPWARGRLGDWKVLIGELGMVLNLAPPIAGIVLARRREFSSAAVWTVVLGVLFTFFYGFTSGTRNLLVTFVTTFSVAYAFTLPPERKREIFWVTGLSGAALLAATIYMLDFRNIGFANYLNRDYMAAVQAEKNEDPAVKKEKTLFVDYNLYVIAKLITVFPERHEYLGLEIPYLSLIRPIPRALWPGKPEGLSLSIEDALGAEQLTLASSFIGEAYISGGFVGVFSVALVFGATFGWWNRFGDPGNSSFGYLVFASGFFAAVISMRSMFVFTTAILPTIAALLLGNWLLSSLPARRSAR